MTATRETTAAAEAAPVRDVQAGRGYTVAAFIHAAYALAIFPPLFGAVGVVLGIIAVRKGDPKGRIAAGTAALAAVLGLLISAVLAYGAAGLV
jgi:hypothetical protein